MKKPPEPHRIDFNYDKLGRKIGVNYYFKATIPHIQLINTLLKECEHYLDDSDEKMLRKILRTKDYSEYDVERLKELRQMYIVDKKT